MRKRRIRRNRRNKKWNRLLFFALAFWLLMGATTLSLLNRNGEAVLSMSAREMGKECIAAVVEPVSRGLTAQRSSPEEDEENAISKNGITKVEDGGKAEPAALGDILLVDSRTGTETASANGEAGSEAKDSKPDASAAETASAAEQKDGVQVKDSQEPLISENPRVLIYHTHATESYQPVSDGNFHSQNQYGTVREAGNILASGLQEKGIGVIHDKTLHDVPSYNKSYSRSLETVQSYLAKYPSIEIVIDLHRDAASYSGNKGYTFTYNGKTGAQFSLVVGQNNANVNSLNTFAKQVIAKANELYPGLGRSVIPKEYRYNEYVSDRYLLLELGNNQNTIEQVDYSASLLADVIAGVLPQ